MRFKLLTWAFVHLVVCSVCSNPLCSRAVYLRHVVLVATVKCTSAETAPYHEEVSTGPSGGSNGGQVLMKGKQIGAIGK